MIQRPTRHNTGHIRDDRPANLLTDAKHPQITTQNNTNLKNHAKTTDIPVGKNKTKA